MAINKGKNKMTTNLDQSLTQLSDKLNVSVDIMFNAMMFQASIEAFICSLIILLTSITWFFVNKYVKDKEGDFYDRDFVFGCFYTYSVVCLLILFINIEIILTCAINPEYWALKQILGA